MQLAWRRAASSTQITKPIKTLSLGRAHTGSSAPAAPANSNSSYSSARLATQSCSYQAIDFEFARDARDPSEAVAAIVLAAPDELGQLTDLAAWEPETGRMALLLGRVSMLGQDNLYGWRLCEPLLMHDTPLEWLMAGREGVFVIDPERASPLLRAVEPLGVQSPEFGRQIQAALTIRAPRILVATRRRAP